MITSSQRTEGCIALNKLKLLISEAAYIYDLKSLYIAIETGIDTTAGEAAEAAVEAAIAAAAGGGTDASGGADESLPPTDTDPIVLTPCTNISTTWLETKLAELKSEIESTLTEITNQIRNNI